MSVSTPRPAPRSPPVSLVPRRSARSTPAPRGSPAPRPTPARGLGLEHLLDDPGQLLAAQPRSLGLAGHRARSPGRRQGCAGHGIASSTASSSARSTPVTWATRPAPLAPALSRRATGGLESSSMAGHHYRAGRFDTRSCSAHHASTCAQTPRTEEFSFGPSSSQTALEPTQFRGRRSSSRLGGASSHWRQDPSPTVPGQTGQESRSAITEAHLACDAVCIPYHAKGLSI
jgi:hypothetical protein